MKKYLIIEKTKGVFLGNYGTFPVFANSEIFPAIKAYAFDSKEQAEIFLETELSSDKMEFSIVEINATNNYVSIIELIRQGYGNYTHRMLENVPAVSKAIH